MRSFTKLTTAALATAALVPAAALAAVSVDDISLTKASEHQATVAFETDEKLARGAGGIIRGSVRFDGGRSNIRTSSHEDNRYIATVKSDDRLVTGRRYTVQIRIAGQDPIVRRLRLR